MVAALLLAGCATADGGRGARVGTDSGRLAAGVTMAAFGAPLILSGGLSVLGVAGAGILYATAPVPPVSTDLAIPSFAIASAIAVAEVAIGSALLFFGVEAIGEAVDGPKPAAAFQFPTRDPRNPKDQSGGTPW